MSTIWVYVSFAFLVHVIPKNNNYDGKKTMGAFWIKKNNPSFEALTMEQFKKWSSILIFSFTMKMILWKVCVMDANAMEFIHLNVHPCT
jgi:hypothetical protein